MSSENSSNIGIFPRLSNGRLIINWASEIQESRDLTPPDKQGIKTYSLAVYILFGIFTLGRAVKTIKVEGEVYRVNRQSFEHWKKRLQYVDFQHRTLSVADALERVTTATNMNDISSWYQAICPLSAVGGHDEVHGSSPGEKEGAIAIQSFASKATTTHHVSPSAKFLPKDSMLAYIHEEFGVSPEETQQAAACFSLVHGSLPDETQGVIQDPAGSAIGSSLSGGGASGAIYSNQQFKGHLERIPGIVPEASVFNSGSHLNAKRMLHTHAPQLGGKNLKEALTSLSNAYLGAITLFVDKAEMHGQDTLNLSCISAAIYGQEYKQSWAGGSGHIDPTLTEAALCIALANYLKSSPEGLSEKTLKLFYFKNPELFNKAQNIKAVLEGPHGAGDV